MDYNYWKIYDNEDGFVADTMLDENPYRGLVLFLDEGTFIVRKWNWDSQILYCKRDYNYD